MLIEQVKKLPVIERFIYFIKEREKVRQLKESGAAPPWTDDRILQRYRFCNVVRMNDKVSRWLMEKWYRSNYGHPNMLIACAIARFFNKPESLGLINKYVFPSAKFGQGHINRIKEIMRKRKYAGETIFNGAYMVRGNDGEDKIASVMDFYVKSLIDTKVQIASDSMEDTWSAILPCHGWGSFMAGQVVADLRHAYPGRWLDRNSWAPMGPGSLRGLNRIAEAPLKRRLTQIQFLNELTLLRKLCQRKLPKGLSQRMEMHDWQNTLCETDKYNRCIDGGRAKQVYRCQ